MVDLSDALGRNLKSAECEAAANTSYSAEIKERFAGRWSTLGAKNYYR